MREKGKKWNHALILERKGEKVKIIYLTKRKSEEWNYAYIFIREKKWKSETMHIYKYIY